MTKDASDTLGDFEEDDELSDFNEDEDEDKNEEKKEFVEDINSEREIMVKENNIQLGEDGWSYYEVQSKEDTLMWIAYKIYGDYGKWRTLANYNKSKLNDNYDLSIGQKIKYKTPSNSFNWNKNGTAYTIIKGDTLGKISKKVYGNMNRWKDLWDYNKPMIKNPDLIFAGFTLYYPE